jgi:hypothetical protein
VSADKERSPVATDPDLNALDYFPGEWIERWQCVIVMGEILVARSGKLAIRRGLNIAHSAPLHRSH